MPALSDRLLKPSAAPPAEKMIAGGDVRDMARWSGKSPFCESALLVRKKNGAAACGDSAFSYSDQEKAVLGVFDGVGREADANLASSKAAAGALSYLKEIKLPDCSGLLLCMKDAFRQAAVSIKTGDTTGVLALILKTGSGVIGSAGDSPAYILRSDGTTEIPLPLDTERGNGARLLDFFSRRSIIFSCLPMTWERAHIAPIQLNEGDRLVLASDGLSNNLFVSVRHNRVTDCSGTADLAQLLGGAHEPAQMIALLAEEVARRIEARSIWKWGRTMISKPDDVSIAALRFK